MGCKTMRMGDVLPETRGTPLGKVVLGQENADFFVFGEYEDEPASPEADSGKTVVVFKTRERHPSWRAARVAGFPVRALKTTISTVFDKIGDLLTFWKPKKDRAKGVAATATEAVRQTTPSREATEGRFPQAFPPAERETPPAPPVETQEAGTREDAAFTETLNWAETIAFPLYGSTPQIDQTGG